MILFTFCLCCILIVASCTSSPQRTLIESTGNLVDQFDAARVLSDETVVSLHESAALNKYLLENWSFVDEKDRSKFPWPQIASSPATVHLNWNTRNDRRIKLKFLNINRNSRWDEIELSLNGHAVPRLGRPQPQNGTIEFYLPMSLQKSGDNIIGLILPSIQSSDANSPMPAIHSFQISEGAAIQAPITIHNQIRPSILLSSPISVEFTVSSPGDAVLDFDYSFIIDDPQSIDPNTLSLDVTIANTDSRSPVNRERVTFDRTDMVSKSWIKKRIKLALPKDRAILLTLSFAGVKINETNPVFLAISELSLYPQLQNLEKRLTGDQPDVLVITLGGVGANIMPCYGYSTGLTPSIDRISSESLLLSDVFTPTNTSIPNITSLFSTMTASQHGVYTTPDPRSSQSINNMLTQPFKDVGYSVSNIVPSTQRYHDFFKLMPSIERTYLYHPELDSSSAVLSQLQACLTSAKTKSRPMFCFLYLRNEASAADPIMPFDVKQYGENPILTDRLVTPLQERQEIIRKLGDRSDVRHLLCAEDTSVHRMDRTIESIFKQVRLHRSKRDLHLIITADHGMITSDAPNIFSSDSLSQQVLHVPLIVGSFCRQSFESRIIDTPFPQTLTSMLIHAIRQSRQIDAEWLSSLAATYPDTCFAEHSTRRIVAMRRGNWKLIHCLSNPYYRISVTNLFDLDREPDEMRSSASQEPDVRDEMLNELLRFTDRSRIYPKPKPSLSSEALSLLSSLNYY